MTALAATGAKRPSAAAPLGNYANNSSPSPPAQASARSARRWRRRRERHKLRYELRSLTELKRVKKCGYCTAGGDGKGPGLRVTVDGKGGAIAGFSGLTTCGSVWVCPVCSAKIATRRAEDLADFMRFALEQGCRASMVTLTMRHHEGQTLQECWDALSKAWAAVTSGKQWVTDSDGYGLRGWVKAVEVTRGKSGWHVHIHVLMIWDAPVTRKQARFVGERMWRRWNRALERRGFDSLRDSGGLDVRMASLRPGAGSGLHEYFVKLSHEITGGQAKLAKGHGRTPFQLLSDAVATGEAADIHSWWEWEQASHGRRQMAWSKGLREWAGMKQEQTDEEIADEQLEAEDVLFIVPESWHHLRRDPMMVCELLEVTEGGGYAAAMPWLERHGFGYVVVGVLPHRPPPHGHEYWQLRRDRQQEAHALMGMVSRELEDGRKWQQLLAAIDGRT